MSEERLAWWRIICIGFEGLDAVWPAEAYMFLFALSSQSVYGFSELKVQKKLLETSWMFQSTIACFLFGHEQSFSGFKLKLCCVSSLAVLFQVRSTFFGLRPISKLLNFDNRNSRNEVNSGDNKCGVSHRQLGFTRVCFVCQPSPLARPSAINKVELSE